ncbi:MAG: hypothetical protein O2960_10935 [Verrucomicrobia bacterium]|nr:hypothetical protein [Verrucomicrobiota bacterium]
MWRHFSSIPHRESVFSRSFSPFSAFKKLTLLFWAIALVIAVPVSLGADIIRRSGSPASVNYEAISGTATQEVDYLPVSGTLVFPPGVTNQVVVVTILDDALNERSETVILKLSNPANASLLPPGQAIATILDDDPPPRLMINSTAVLEGNSGTTNAIFTISLSSASGRTVTVNYSTSDATATAGEDYIATSGSLIFEPGETSKNISVPVIGDMKTENGNELFFVNLTNAQNATAPAGPGIGIIVDDESPPPANMSPTISKVGDQFIIEGKSSDSVAFTVGDFETPVSDLTLGAVHYPHLFDPIKSYICTCTLDSYV